MTLGNPQSTQSLLGNYNTDQVPSLIFQPGSTISGANLVNPVINPSPFSFVPATNSTALGTTLSAASLICGSITRSGPSAAFTDTTDTAANIIALIGAVVPVNSAIDLFIKNTTNFPQTLTGGTGVTISGGNIVGPNNFALYAVTVTGASTVTLTLLVANSNTIQAAQFATGTTTTTFAAGQLTGGATAVYTNTGATPGSIATRTATQMIADMPFDVVVGTSWLLRVINGQGTGTLTITAGGGVTLTGTMTVAANTFRDFICTVTATGTPAITIQNAGVGTFS